MVFRMDNTQKSSPLIHIPTIFKRKKQDKQVKQDKKEKEERAINPMAIRPADMKVSLKTPNKKIDAIKSLFGF
jgi:hypothetical protein